MFSSSLENRALCCIVPCCVVFQKRSCFVSGDGSCFFLSHQVPFRKITLFDVFRLLVSVTLETGLFTAAPDGHARRNVM